MKLDCYLELKNSDDKWHVFGQSTTRVNQNFTAIPVYTPITIDVDTDTMNALHPLKGFPRDLSYELKLTFDVIKQEIRACTGQFSIKHSLVSYMPYTELPAELKNFIDNNALDIWRTLSDDIKRVVFISSDNARSWSNRLL